MEKTNVLIMGSISQSTVLISSKKTGPEYENPGCFRLKALLFVDLTLQFSHFLMTPNRTAQAFN